MDFAFRMGVVRGFYNLHLHWQQSNVLYTTFWMKKVQSLNYILGWNLDVVKHG